jgi:biopolymer transport protein ExbB
MKALTLICLAALPVFASAQSLQQTQSSVKQDLDNAMEELANLREQIREEKVPMSENLNALRAEAQELRREADQIARVRDNRSVSLERLRDDIEGLEETLTYISNLLTDYARRFESNLSVAEVQLYKDEVDQVLALTQEGADTDPLTREAYEAQFTLLDTALNHLKNVIGGYIFEGNAILPDGENTEGEFLLLGPVSYFSASDGSISGVIPIGRNAIRPEVVSEIPSAGNIQTIISGNSARLPFDPTLNDALELQVNKVTWRDEIVEQGGVWIWPIVVFATVAILIAIFKFFEIYSVKMPKENQIGDIITLVNEGNKDAAMKEAKAMPGPFGKLMRDAVEHSDESSELIEEVLYERMLETRPTLERLLPFIAVTAATAPLLGLLGTVTGMINTFKQITLFGTSDASKLAGGISEALVTTKYGLIAAIPALILHALLSRKAQGVLAEMERVSATFVNGLSKKKS